jgi:hypothetical protein
MITELGIFIKILHLPLNINYHISPNIRRGFFKYFFSENGGGGGRLISAGEMMQKA